MNFILVHCLCFGYELFSKILMCFMLGFVEDDGVQFVVGDDGHAVLGDGEIGYIDAGKL